MTDQPFSLTDSMRNLEQTFSRGLSLGWLEGVNPHRLVSGSVTSHRGTKLGTVIEVRRDASVVLLTDSVRRGDGVLFENVNEPDRSQGGRVYEIIRRRESVTDAEAGAKVLLTFANNSIDAQYVAENQTVWKTDDPHRQREIGKTWKNVPPRKNVALTINIMAESGKPMEIIVKSRLGADIHLTSTDKLEEARKHLLSQKTLQEQLGRLGGTIYNLTRLNAQIVGRPMIPLSVLGSLRRDMIARLDELLHRQKPYVMTEQTLESIRIANRDTVLGERD